MAIKAYMICHVHWDREWYLTKNQFRSKLVRLVDSVLDTVERNPALSFMLDGQTIVLEDYLEIRPENEERLRRAISSGAVSIGPWYILPDEILVSGEAHIRNYLIGQKVCDRFGRKMNLGYLPDSFGHPEQMPQILRGLTMDTALFWRGVPNSISSSEFRWQSADPESDVLAMNMVHGYGNSARIEAEPDVFVPRLKTMMDRLAARSNTDLVLLMNGNDHILNQAEIGEIVEQFNRACGPDYEIQISTMEQFVQELQAKLPELDSYQGELRSGDRSMLLAGTVSTRTYLKQWNARVQRRMERYLEPASVTQRFCGLEHGFAGYQDYLWRKILENHPHDSICGCSVDAVHAEMVTRFRRTSELEDTLFSDVMNTLGVQQNQEPAGGVQMLLFEPTQDSLPTCVEVDVDFDPVLVQKTNFAQSTIDEYESMIQHPELPAGVTVTDNYGRTIPARLLRAEKAYFNHLQDLTAPEVYKVNRCRVALQLPAFPYGVSALYFRRAEAQPPAPKRSVPYIENEYFRVSLDGNGSFCVTCKENGKSYRGAAKLVDKGDAGDEYTYSWPAQDTVCTLARTSVTSEFEEQPGVWQKLTMSARFRLPKGLEEDRQSRSSTFRDCPVRITVTLFRGRNDVDFQVEFENNVKDHILQLEFSTGVCADVSSASSAFAVTERPIHYPIPETWMEYPLPTYPTHGFVDVSTEKGGLTLISDGLNEFEVVNEGNESRVRLTLLRCVGDLSRADLASRKGNGGWCYATPEAQCLGRHVFHCAAVYHRGSWREAGTLKQADRVLHPPLLTPVFLAPGVLAPANPLSCLSQLPEDVRLSACKLSEDNSGVIVRVFSTAEAAQTVRLPLPDAVTAVSACNLAETERTPLPCEDGVLEFPIRPGQIRTFFWELRSNH